MAATVRLSLSSQLRLRDHYTGCDFQVAAKHVTISVSGSRSNGSSSVKVSRSVRVGGNSIGARLGQRYTRLTNAKQVCCNPKASNSSVQLDRVDGACCTTRDGAQPLSDPFATPVRRPLLHGRRRTIFGCGRPAFGQLCRKGLIDFKSLPQSAAGSRHRLSVRARASDSNLIIERPAVKQHSSQKEEIYKGLEDSPAKVERCVIVDEENNVVGEASRADTVGNRLWGRGVYCLVQNRRGQLLVTQRTEEKDLYPGHLDVVVSGCVNVGEEYSDTIVRELSEELGLTSVDRSSLTPLFLFKWVDEFCRIWGCGYHYVTDCETFDLQVEEVQWCKWMDLDEVEELIQTARFTPVGLSVLRRFLRERQPTHP